MDTKFICARCSLELYLDASGWSSEWLAVDKDAETTCTIHIPMRIDS